MPRNHALVSEFHHNRSYLSSSRGIAIHKENDDKDIASGHWIICDRHVRD